MPSYYRRVYWRPRRRSFVPGYNGTVTPAPAALVFTGGAAPSINTTLTPAPATVAFSGQTSPVGTQLNPAAAALAFSGQTSPVGTQLNPAAASLAFSGGAAPQLRVVVSPAAASLLFTGAQAVLGVILNPSAASLLFTGGAVYVIVRVVDYGMRVDVYAAGNSPARLCLGPITQVVEFEYGNGVDQIGDAVLTLAATDPKVLDITELGQLRVYRGGEGRIFVGRVRETEWGQDASGVALLRVIMDDLAADLAIANTGLGLTLAAASPATTLSTLLAVPALSGSGWTSGSVDSSPDTISKRHEADGVWEALIADAPKFSAHVRHDSITSPSAPVVDLGAFGADSGLQFGIGQYPLAEIRKHKTAAGVVNRIIGFAQGEGNTALTLKAASHGANLCTNANFEVDVSGWAAPTNSTFARSAAQAKLGSYSGLLTRTSSTSFYTSFSSAISGASTGRSWSASFWIYGTGSAIGKTLFAQLLTSGGSSSVTDTESPVIVAGWQRVSLSVTAADSNSTAVAIIFGIVSGAGAGDVLYIDKVRFWESTYYAYCVEQRTSPGGIDEWFIEDEVASAAYGVREKYMVAKAAYPTVATKAAWVAACDLVYDLCVEELQLNTSTLSTYSAKVLGLNHVSAGAQQVKVGDKSKLFFHGATADGAWLTVDQLLWLMKYRRRLTAAGLNEWDMALASIDLRHQDAIERLAAQMAEYRSGGTELKQSNWVYSMPIRGYPTLDAVLVDVTDVLRNMISIQRATLVFQQIAGGSLDTYTGVFPVGSSPTTTNRSAISLSTNYTDVLTTALQCPPTPVPLTGDGVTTKVFIGFGKVGTPADALIQGTITIEGTKLPFAPA